MDKKDMFSYFLHLRKIHGDIDYIFELFNNENYNINKLDITRIYKYIDILCKTSLPSEV